MKKPIVLLILSIQITFSVFGQEKEKFETEFFQLRDNLYMATHSYPNIAILVGEDGLFLVDANQKINISNLYLDIQKKFNNLPIEYVVNTHFHGDHTGGNAFLSEKGAKIIAHKTNKATLLKHGKEGNVNELNKRLPSITFSNEMEFHFGNEDLELIHVEDTHTKGDAIIYFKTSNAIALGDNYFGNAYTFGGNVEGMITAYEKVITMIDDETIIIPGHGVHSSKKELIAYLAMIKDVKAQIDAEKAKGKTLEEIKANTSITKKYDEKYGKLYINGERFRDLIYNGSNSNWRQ